MRLNCLKTKPPAIPWTPIATLGLAASVASYTGATIGTFCNEPLFVYSLSIMVATAGMACSTRAFKISCITVSVFLLFLGRSVHEGERGSIPWTVLLDGELVRLRCEITSEPRTMLRTRGPMLPFDYRGPATRFYAKASPINTSGSHYQQERISVRIDGGCVLQRGK